MLWTPINAGTIKPASSAIATPMLMLSWPSRRSSWKVVFHFGYSTIAIAKALMIMSLTDTRTPDSASSALSWARNDIASVISTPDVT